VRRKSFRVLPTYRHRYNGYCRNFRYKQKNRQGPTGEPTSVDEGVSVVVPGSRAFKRASKRKKA